MSLDSTKFFFSFRLEATGQVLEYKRAEISGDSAKMIFRLANVQHNVLFPPSIQQQRIEQADKDRAAGKAPRKGGRPKGSKNRPKDKTSNKSK